MARPEDIDLALENSPRLNADFYRSEPHAYFRHRRSNLMLVAAKDEELSRLIGEGLSFGLVSIGSKGDEPKEYTESDRESAFEFVALEAEVLLHHATETLLRLFLAHVGVPPSPWLEMSRLRSFGEFKRILSRRFVDSIPEDRASDLAEVFYGSPDPASYDPPPSADEWAESISTIDRFLVRFASNLLKDAHLYNAAKHGLAVKPGEYGLTVGDNENPMIHRHGMALQYLQAVDGQWRRTAEWVETDSSIVYVELAAELMAQLWTVARHRYTGEGEIEAKIWKNEIHKVLEDATQKQMGKGPALLKSMSESLLYYASPEEE